MSDIIHLLPDSVANQIAAGEVVQRPASVVKELMENAIDAGATSIEVILKDAGRTLIQVVDNGKGMSETDARMAFERHATSKISSAADLFAIRTMGFRGEALASIAAIAQVELRTRRKEDDLGTCIVVSGSKVESQTPVQCAAGSAFFVKNLFFNVPARRKFLKSNETELRHILNEFIRIAVVYSELQMKISNNDSELYDLTPTNRRQRIAHIFGAKTNNFSRQLLPVNADTSLAKISGFVSTPETALRNANQYFFVNDRYMRHPYFHKAVMQSFENLIAKDVSPNYFLYFDVDPATIDVNIHPTKTEIKFENETAIWSIIAAVVKEALGKSNAAPSIEFDQEGAIPIPVFDRQHAPQQPKVSINPSYNPFQNSSHPPMNWEKLYQDFEKPDSEKDTLRESYDIPSSINFDTPATEFNSYLLYKGRYIITGGKSGLMLIDKQRAHIRVLFEHYMEQLARHAGMSQQLLFPEILEFNAADAVALESMLKPLQYVGFDIALFGKNTFSVNGIPSGVEGKSILTVIEEILDSITHKDSSIKTSLDERIALSLAKASAINASQSMTDEEMNHLTGKLFTCSNPNITPDGKPVVVILSNEEIERRF